jgi:hypothetical protein
MRQLRQRCWPQRGWAVYFCVNLIRYVSVYTLTYLITWHHVAHVPSTRAYRWHCGWASTQNMIKVDNLYPPRPTWQFCRTLLECSVGSGAKKEGKGGIGPWCGGGSTRPSLKVGHTVSIYILYIGMDTAKSLAAASEVFVSFRSCARHLRRLAGQVAGHLCAGSYKSQRGRHESSVRCTHCQFSIITGIYCVTDLFCVFVARITPCATVHGAVLVRCCIHTIQIG